MILVEFPDPLPGLFASFLFTWFIPLVALGYVVFYVAPRYARVKNIRRAISMSDEGAIMTLPMSLILIVIGMMTVMSIAPHPLSKQNYVKDSISDVFGVSLTTVANDLSDEQHKEILDGVTPLDLGLYDSLYGVGVKDTGEEVAVFISPAERGGDVGVFDLENKGWIWNADTTQFPEFAQEKYIGSNLLLFPAPWWWYVALVTVGFVAFKVLARMAKHVPETIGKIQAQKQYA